MFICIYCEREFNKKEGNTLHTKYCKLNPHSIKRITGGSFRPGHSGKASTPEKEKIRSDKLSIIAKKNKLGGYVHGSGRGKNGWYKGFFCDSSWELAYVIYCLEHNVSITRNTVRRQYYWDGKIRDYIPDFVVSGTVIEIKGYKTSQWLAKMEANPDIEVLYEKDLQPILKYVKLKYGKNFIDLYE